MDAFEHTLVAMRNQDTTSSCTDVRPDGVIGVIARQLATLALKTKWDV